MSSEPYTFTSWFRTNWSRVCIPAALILLVLSPFLLRGLSLAAFLIFLQLPVYMFHQYEEHGHGAFRAYVNHVVGHDRDILTETAIFWINIIGVWALALCALYLAVYVGLALGLFAIYLLIVNGLSHIGMAVAMRRYNPGLWTSVALFLPVGGYALYRVSMDSHATVSAQALGLGIALVVHALVLVVIRRRAAALKPVVAQPVR